MDKSPDAFRTISEVAQWLGTPAHVLRFWESKFSQVKPVKRAGGRRYYRPDDMRLLGGIKKLLHEDGMTIKGAQKLLRTDGIKQVADLSQSLDAISESAAEAPVVETAPKPASQTDQPMLMELQETQPAPKPKSPPSPVIAKPPQSQTADLPLVDTQAAADKKQKITALYARLSDLHSRMQTNIGA